ncbi:hypothetical protein T11_15675 [Trichinella zimbabwensis]|uniref:Uncharacterized protein n=1 Tax=Trichinella zimbabwensis TaxID=268475 RepID=A0A0V1I1H6_9BILA|nr:hypothetical protein T11_15675 [Trichinella zimbabwensis]
MTTCGGSAFTKQMKPDLDSNMAGTQSVQIDPSMSKSNSAVSCCYPAGTCLEMFFLQPIAVFVTCLSVSLALFPIVMVSKQAIENWADTSDIYFSPQLLHKMRGVLTTSNFPSCFSHRATSSPDCLKFLSHVKLPNVHTRASISLLVAQYFLSAWLILQLANVTAHYFPEISCDSTASKPSISASTSMKIWNLKPGCSNANPKNCCNSFVDLGIDHCSTASTFPRLVERHCTNAMLRYLRLNTITPPAERAASNKYRGVTIDEHWP